MQTVILLSFGWNLGKFITMIVDKQVQRDDWFYVWYLFIDVQHEGGRSV